MSSRKLQGTDTNPTLAEIDRTLKKIAEGIEIFDGIIDKLHGSISNNQKEKLELELKKEIKKLQRHRDQIKNWLSLNEVKEKEVLMETRRLIEAQMEKFKACEKEMKTKAYSKEGLSLASKSDPKEKERQAIIAWLAQAAERLQAQTSNFESELESLDASFKKSKKTEAGKLERQKLLERTIESHRMHIDKMEIMQRMLENGSLAAEKLTSFKEDMEYYMECSMEPDFVGNAAIYDDLDLQEPSAENSEMERSEAEESAGEQEKREETEEKSRKAASKNMESKATPVQKTEKGVLQKQAGSSQMPVQGAAPSLLKRTTSAAYPLQSAPVQPSEPALAPASVWANAPKSVMADPSKEKRKADSLKVDASMHKPEPSFSEVLSAGIKQEVSFAAIAASSKEYPSPAEVSHIQHAAIQESEWKAGAASFEKIRKLLEDLKSKKLSSSKSPSDFLLKSVENSFMNIPDFIDLDRNRNYTARNSYATPSYYPQKPPVLFDNPSSFERFDIDTLFFIFYYQQKTLQQ